MRLLSLVQHLSNPGLSLAITTESITINPVGFIQGHVRRPSPVVISPVAKFSISLMQLVLVDHLTVSRTIGKIRFGPVWHDPAGENVSTTNNFVPAPSASDQQVTTVDLV
jgi:hypothetical protein